MTRLNSRLFATSGLVLGCALIAAPAAAQTAPPPATAEVETIVVTAQKRAERLQDVSASIAAVSGSDIAETGKNGFADVMASVPSLSMVSQGPGLSTLALRGITTGGVRNDEPQNKETVGVYIDETPISVNGFNPDLGLYDISRIEVLRGPQGTLYGSGSMGGTIRIITNKPRFGSFEGSAEATLSQTEHGGTNSGVKGMVNIPLAEDGLALRAIAYRTYTSGYIDNDLTGQHNINDAETTGARVELGARIGENLRANFSYMIHDLETGGRSEQTSPYRRLTRGFDGLTDRINIFNATLDYDLGWAGVTSSTSYMKKRNTNRNSLEFLLNTAFGFNSTAPLVDTTAIEDFSQEFRITSSGDGRLNYVVGAFYQDRKRDYTQAADVAGIDAFTGTSSTGLGAQHADQAFYGVQDIHQKQKSLFGEVSYKLTDKLTATAGLRYFDFNEAYRTYSSGLLNGGADSGRGNFSESGFTPKFNLSLAATKDNLIYLQVAKGFRLGGVNTTVPVDLCRADLERLGRTNAAGSFGSDSVWNYEIGSKNQLMDRRLTLNASAYLIDWSNIQTTLNLPSCSFSFRTNAGTARSLGTEIEARYAFTKTLEVYGNLGFTDSTLTEDVPFTPWKKGDRVPGVAKYQVSAGARQALTWFKEDDSYVRLDYSYVSSMNTNFDTNGVNSRRYGDYHIVNLQAGVRVPGRPLEVSLFARNLLDGDGRVLSIAGGLVGPERFITVQPRTVGVTLQATF